MKKVIITGSTGMVGKSVLIECLEHPQIEKILLISRSSLKMQHPKVEELLLADFTEIGEYQDRLSEYDACFHNMGVSSVGMSKQKYEHLTYDISKALANAVYDANPEAVFVYVSGEGTDETEKGPIAWARVKGKTENYIFNKGFKDAYAFRPGAILPVKEGIKSKTGWVNITYVLSRPLFPLLKKMRGITTSTDIGQAMINTLFYPQDLKRVENKDINQMAKR